MMTQHHPPFAGREKILAARLSVIAGAFLVCLKLAVGVATGSIAVLSEAAHSATDLLAAVIAFFAVRASDAPPDEKHPYGHGKLESISSVIEALLIAIAGIFIIVEAALALLRLKTNGQAAPTPVWGVAVMAFSVVVNTIVAGNLRRVAHKTDSLALHADSRHLMTDVWTSAGVFVGLLLAWITGKTWLDPLAALIVAVVVLRTAYMLARDATDPLVDGRLPDAEIRQVEQTMRGDPRILSWHKLRTRKSGSQRHIDVHIQVDDTMSLKEAHQVTEELEDRIREALANAQVMIHTEPYEEEIRHHAEVPH